jgi:hypothetical protein
MANINKKDSSRRQNIKNIGFLRPKTTYSKLPFVQYIPYLQKDQIELIRFLRIVSPNKKYMLLTN